MNREITARKPLQRRASRNGKVPARSFFEAHFPPEPCLTRGEGVVDASIRDAERPPLPAALHRSRRLAALLFILALFYNRTIIVLLFSYIFVYI